MAKELKGKYFRKLINFKINQNVFFYYMRIIDKKSDMLYNATSLSDNIHKTIHLSTCLATV